MTWTDFEEKYGETKEDHTDTAEDEREACSICGMLFLPEDLATREVVIRNRKSIEYWCPECLNDDRHGR